MTKTPPSVAPVPTDPWWGLSSGSPIGVAGLVASMTGDPAETGSDATVAWQDRIQTALRTGHVAGVVAGLAAASRKDFNALLLNEESRAALESVMCSDVVHAVFARRAEWNIPTIEMYESPRYWFRQCRPDTDQEPTPDQDRRCIGVFGALLERLPDATAEESGLRWDPSTGRILAVSSRARSWMERGVVGAAVQRHIIDACPECAAALSDPTAKSERGWLRTIARVALEDLDNTFGALRQGQAHARARLDAALTRWLDLPLWTDPTVPVSAWADSKEPVWNRRLVDLGASEVLPEVRAALRDAPHRVRALMRLGQTHIWENRGYLRDNTMAPETTRLLGWPVSDLFGDSAVAMTRSFFDTTRAFGLVDLMVLGARDGSFAPRLLSTAHGAQVLQAASAGAIGGVLWGALMTSGIDNVRDLAQRIMAAPTDWADWRDAHGNTALHWVLAAINDPAVNPKRIGTRTVAQITNVFPDAMGVRNSAGATPLSFLPNKQAAQIARKLMRVEAPQRSRRFGQPPRRRM